MAVFYHLVNLPVKLYKNAPLYLIITLTNRYSIIVKVTYDKNVEKCNTILTHCKYYFKTIKNRLKLCKYKLHHG